MNSIVLDIEMLGTEPGCTVMSVGAAISASLPLISPTEFGPSFMDINQPAFPNRAAAK